MFPPLIVLYSPFPRMGKGTIADMLVERYNYTKVSFADPLRRICENILFQIGFDPLQVHHYLNVDKYEKIPGLNVNGRQFMQKTGTEYIRRMLNEHFFVECWNNKVKSLHEQGIHSIVCDDCRFPDEFTEAYSHNAFFLGVTRRSRMPRKPVTPRALSPLIDRLPFASRFFHPYHASDNRLSVFGMDAVVSNDSSIPDLLYTVREVLMGIEQ